MAISFGIVNLVWEPRPSIVEGTQLTPGWTLYEIPVRRSGDTTQSLTINWTITFSGITSPVIGESVSPASATDISSGVTGVLVFEAGVSQLFIPVLITADSIPESTEYFIVTVTDASTGVSISDQFGIVDDDTSVLAITTNSAILIQEEGTGAGTTEFVFTVTRTGKTTGTCAANWRINSSEVNANDFENSVIPFGTVNFGDGETSKTISIRVLQDSVVEFNESFQVSLVDPVGAVIDVSRQSAGAQIINDDGTALAIAASSANKFEGTGAGVTAYTFTVTRTGTTTGTSTVNWGVSGSAINPTDFEGGVIPSGSLSFLPSETSKTITVNVVQDATVEANEAFAVTISSPSVGTTIVTPTANGTIINDDGTALAIVATSANKVEGTGAGVTAYTFTVTRTGTTTGTSTVNWGVSGSAINATDFEGGVIPSGSLSFLAGETSKIITVNVVQDATVEANEAFAVTISSPSVGTTIVTPTATGTIINDDGTALAIAASSANKVEGTGAGVTAYTFTVTRTGTTTGTSTVNWGVSGSAINPTDFEGGVIPSGSLSFLAGETSKIITVNVVQDATVEADEAFAVTISNPVGGTITTATANGLIVNDDGNSTTHLFANLAPIQIPDNLEVQPFSVITVDGITGIVSGIAVTVLGLTHQFLEDLDIALVAPTGAGTMLASDIYASALGATIKFTDNAGLSLPTYQDQGLPGIRSVVATGIYKPTDQIDGDPLFPDPTDFGTTYGQTLSSLNGISPNGDWTLRIKDDFNADLGTVSGGWILEFQVIT